MLHVRPLAVAAFLSGLPLPLAAQTGTVAGAVRLAGDGAPVAGATVVIVGTRLGALTDSLGRFRIAHVPAGVQQVEARQIGKTLDRRTVAVRPGETIDVSLVLADAPTQLAGVTVIGHEADALSRIPGSAAVISEERLAATRPISANEVLRSIPGVHVQEEEGAGLRANIGIRGLDPDRSRTVLVLEDGVPVALAPYGEPEMYYSPPIDRMARVEIIKGSGSILFGPQTIGGVVNYVTADAPVVPAGAVELLAGTGNVSRLKAAYGGTWGRTRAAATAFRKQADDWNGLFFDVKDVTAKVGLRTDAGDFGAKLSVYGEESNATYVGLTDSLYRASPHVHPQPADRLDIERYALTGTHQIALGRATTLRTNVYGYKTTRDWTRRDYTYNETGSSYVWRNTTGSRDRSFDVAGIEPHLVTHWRAGGIDSDLDVGLRAHYERARDQHVNGSLETGESTVRDDERRRGRALAAYVQNRFYLGQALRITPGVRFEHFSYEREILRTRIRRTDPEGGTSREIEDVDLPAVGDELNEVIPGLGASWTPNATVTVFAGAHRGFAPPRTKDALIYEDPTLEPDQQVPAPVSLQLDAERSWNYEIGTRLTPTSFLSLEATAFHLAFSNQIIEPSLSAGSVSQAALANQGATRHSGLELGVGLDVGRLMRRPFTLALDVSYTYVDAVFSRDRYVENAAGDTVNVKGNRLPYAPEHQGHAAVTFSHPAGLLLRVDATHVSEQFADNFETVAATANGRVGRIPSYRIYDLSAQYALPKLRGVTLIGTVKNLTDETYIASRRPEGIKPGLERIASLGLSWNF